MQTGFSKSRSFCHSLGLPLFLTTVQRLADFLSMVQEQQHERTVTTNATLVIPPGCVSIFGILRLIVNRLNHVNCAFRTDRDSRRFAGDGPEQTPILLRFEARLDPGRARRHQTSSFFVDSRIEIEPRLSRARSIPRLWGSNFVSSHARLVEL